MTIPTYFLLSSMTHTSENLQETLVTCTEVFVILTDMSSYADALREAPSPQRRLRIWELRSIESAA